MNKVYYESLEEAIEKNKPNIASTKRKPLCQFFLNAQL